MFHQLIIKEISRSSLNANLSSLIGHRVNECAITLKQCNPCNLLLI